MPNQNLAKELEIAKRRARQLGIDLGSLNSGKIIGAYYSKPLNLIEYCLHEAAHLMTLGHEPSEFTTLRRMRGIKLTDIISERFDRISQDVADLLEVDTAKITFTAGKALGFWDNPEAIINSTQKNLSLNSRVQNPKFAQEAFDQLTPDYDTTTKVRLLRQWFITGR